MTTRRSNVSRIMNRDLITTRSDAQLAPVVELMMRRGLTEIPVVDHDHALLGFVTRQALVEPQRLSSTPEEFIGSEQRKGSIHCELDRGFRLDVESEATVADVMRPNVVCVKADATAREAAVLMTENHVNVLPVVSAFGILLGTVSAVDLMGLWL
jgi:CBS-domain-containing membrane protein